MKGENKLTLCRTHRSTHVW